MGQPRVQNYSHILLSLLYFVCFEKKQLEYLHTSINSTKTSYFDALPFLREVPAGGRVSYILNSRAKRRGFLVSYISYNYLKYFFISSSVRIGCSKTSKFSKRIIVIPIEFKNSVLFLSFFIPSSVK